MSGRFHWVPDYAMEESTGYNTDIHTFESGKEQGRLKHGNSKKSFTLDFRNITETQLNDMLAFFKLQHGAEQTFTWVDPTNNTLYTVRFASDEFSYDRVTDNVYNIKIQFKRTV